MPFGELLPAWMIMVPIAWGLLGWIVLPRLTLRRAERRMAAGYYDPLMADVIERAVPKVVDAVKENLQFRVMGTLSGESKRDKALDRAIGEDLLTQNDPALGMVLQSFFPSVHKFLAQKPEYAQTAIERLGPMLAKMKVQRTGANGSASGERPW